MWRRYVLEYAVAIVHQHVGGRKGTERGKDSMIPMGELASKAIERISRLRQYHQSSLLSSLSSSRRREYLSPCCGHW